MLFKLVFKLLLLSILFQMVHSAKVSFIYVSPGSIYSRYYTNGRKLNHNFSFLMKWFKRAQKDQSECLEVFFSCQLTDTKTDDFTNFEIFDHNSAFSVHSKCTLIFMLGLSTVYFCFRTVNKR